MYLHRMLATTLVVAATIVPAAFTDPPTGPPTALPMSHCATATTTCTDTVDVPLNRDDPASERLSVAFQRIPRHDLSRPATGTLLVHMGGPGPSIRSTERVVGLLGPVLDRQDLVLADLRGMGMSSPIGCTGLDVDDPTTIGPCTEQLGPRGQFFGTAQAVDDYDAVRAALGLDRWTLLGNSYGSELVQAYAARFPDRVAAVLLSGVVPATPDGFFGTGGVAESVRSSAQHLQDACAASPVCQGLPGTTADRLAAVVADLRGAAPGDVPRLVAALENAVFEAGPRRDLNAALDAHLHGDPAPLRRLLGDVPPKPNRPPLPPERAATLLTFQCNDAHLPYDRTAPIQERADQLTEFVERERPYAPFTAAEATAGSLLLDTAPFCLRSPLLSATSAVDLDAEHPRVPVLEIQGTGDPLSTIERGTTAARFPMSTYIEVPYGRHGTWSSGERHPVAGSCQLEMMREFLIAPRTPAVDHGCDLTVYQLHGAFPRTAEQLPPADGPPSPGATVIAAAFATVADALVPQYPTDGPALQTYERPGLRGGTAVLTDGLVTLTGARFVEDVVVDGTVRLDAQFLATAEITATGADGTHELELRWPMLDPATTVPVSGTVDGRAFAAHVPAF